LCTPTAKRGQKNFIKMNNIHGTNGILTFISMFLVSITQNIMDNLETLPFAVLQAVLLGIVSVITRNICQKAYALYKLKKKGVKNDE
jgi:hypothetical protein